MTSKDGITMKNTSFMPYLNIHKVPSVKSLHKWVKICFMIATTASWLPQCKKEKIYTVSSFHIHKRCQCGPTYSPLLHWSTQISNLDDILFVRKSHRCLTLKNCQYLKLNNICEESHIGKL